MRHSHSLFIFCLEFTLLIIELALAHSLIHLRVLETEPGALHRLTMGSLSYVLQSLVLF